ncbi:MAG: L,D-transpeptidase [Ilumatobacteraceae bacterium]
MNLQWTFTRRLAALASIGGLLIVPIASTMESTITAPPVVAEGSAEFPTIDGIASGIGIRPSGSVTELLVAGRSGVAADASAVVLNITATAPQGAGFVTVFPCSEARPLASSLNYTAGVTVAAAVVAKVGVAGTVCLFTSNTVHLIADVNGWFPAASGLRPLTPSRLLDTRPGESTVDGAFAGIGTRPGGTTTVLTVADRGGVGTQADAVVLNVTATGSSAAGFVTVYPCADGRPNASNVNYAAGSTMATAVLAKVDSAGTVCLFTSADVHLVVDVNGWFPADNGFTPLQPARVLDSRPDGSTADGVDRGLGLRGAGAITELTIAGRSGVTNGVGAVALTVTVSGPAGPGFVTAYPCAGGRPNASNLNVTTAGIVAAAVVVQVDPAGKVCLFTSMSTQLIVDVNGSFPAASDFTAVQPARLLDSRLTAPPSTDNSALPLSSGAGRRVVYSKVRMRVWKVEADGSVSETYRVSGRMDQPLPGTYQVFSKSLRTCSNHSPDICMRFMVRFAHSFRGDNIGFHEIPARNGRPLQVEDQLGQALSGGCVRQSTADAIRMWDWAQIGTTVVVVD